MGLVFFVALKPPYHALDLGGTLSYNERQTVDGHVGARLRCAKCQPVFAHITVLLCMAQTLTSPRCLLCSAVWVEVGNAHMAFLTFIP